MNIVILKSKSLSLIIEFHTHSHILKVKYDDQLGLLHINPGAAGTYGFHKVRTLVRLEIDGGKFQNLEVIELGMETKLQ